MPLPTPPESAPLVPGETDAAQPQPLSSEEESLDRPSTEVVDFSDYSSAVTSSRPSAMKSTSHRTQAFEDGTEMPRNVPIGGNFFMARPQSLPRQRESSSAPRDASSGATSSSSPPATGETRQTRSISSSPGLPQESSSASSSCSEEDAAPPSTAPAPVPASVPPKPRQPITVTITAVSTGSVDATEPSVTSARSTRSNPPPSIGRAATSASLNSRGGSPAMPNDDDEYFQPFTSSMVSDGHRVNPQSHSPSPRTRVLSEPAGSDGEAPDMLFNDDEDNVVIGESSSSSQRSSAVVAAVDAAEEDEAPEDDAAAATEERSSSDTNSPQNAEEEPSQLQQGDTGDVANSTNSPTAFTRRSAANRYDEAVEDQSSTEEGAEAPRFIDVNEEDDDDADDGVAGDEEEGSQDDEQEFDARDDGDNQIGPHEHIIDASEPDEEDDEEDDEDEDAIADHSDDGSSAAFTSSSVADERHHAHKRTLDDMINSDEEEEEEEEQEYEQGTAADYEHREWAPRNLDDLDSSSEATPRDDADVAVVPTPLVAVADVPPSRSLPVAHPCPHGDSRRARARALDRSLLPLPSTLDYHRNSIRTAPVALPVAPVTLTSCESSLCEPNSATPSSVPAPSAMAPRQSQRPDRPREASRLAARPVPTFAHGPRAGPMATATTVEDRVATKRPVTATAERDPATPSDVSQKYPHYFGQTAGQLVPLRGDATQALVPRYSPRGRPAANQCEDCAQCPYCDFTRCPECGGTMHAPCDEEEPPRHVAAPRFVAYLDKAPRRVCAEAPPPASEAPLPPPPPPLVETEDVPQYADSHPYTDTAPPNDVTRTNPWEDSQWHPRRQRPPPRPVRDEALSWSATPTNAPLYTGDDGWEEPDVQPPPPRFADDSAPELEVLTRGTYPAPMAQPNPVPPARDVPPPLPQPPQPRPEQPHQPEQSPVEVQPPRRSGSRPVRHNPYRCHPDLEDSEPSPEEAPVPTPRTSVSRSWPSVLPSQRESVPPPSGPGRRSDDEDPLVAASRTPSVPRIVPDVTSPAPHRPSTWAGGHKTAPPAEQPVAFTTEPVPHNNNDNGRAVPQRDSAELPPQVGPPGRGWRRYLDGSLRPSRTSPRPDSRASAGTPNGRASRGGPWSGRAAGAWDAAHPGEASITSRRSISPYGLGSRASGTTNVIVYRGQTPSLPTNVGVMVPFTTRGLSLEAAPILPEDPDEEAWRQMVRKMELEKTRIHTESQLRRNGLIS